MSSVTASPLLAAQQRYVDALPWRITGSEELPLALAAGRVVYADVTATHDLPAYPRAIVEGWLVHTAATQAASETAPVTFTVAGSVNPGDEICPSFTPAQVLRVATGSITPAAGYSIIRAWDATTDGDRVTITRPFAPNFFIEEPGCDLKSGALVVAAGEVLTPTHLSTLASLGLATVAVARAPTVAIFSSGNEVIPHTAPFRPGLIRDCNAVGVAAAIHLAGGIPDFKGIRRDDFGGFVAAVQSALVHHDMAVISGGTAIGGRDFISDLISSIGDLIVDGVPMRSGRPLIMGVSGTKPIVCVAGHPPEALRGFKLFGIPALDRLMGKRAELPTE